ncbi:MAG TPA: MFS transporter [Desulfobulbaceae bacterium]|nr:MFS transporter [Desulfobulbaceae bacterium]
MREEQGLQRSTLIVTTVTAFMAPFMLSSVNVALPALQAEFAADAVLLGWIATAYLLATAMVLVPAGKFADIYGRKKVFLSGIVVYTLGSFFAILVPNIWWFLAMRAVQGLGAALFITTSMAIITSVLPPEKRGWGIGILVTAVYAGLATGPFAGGLLTQHFGWRSLFWVMLLLGTGSLLLALRFLRGEWADAREEKFDLPGSLVYAVSIFCLVYGGTRMPEPVAWLLVPGGLLGLFLFYRLQKKAVYPVFAVGLLQNNRVFLFSSLAALIHYAATFAVTFQISLYLQYIQGMSPRAAGVILMIQPVMMTLFSTPAGRLSDRLEPRLLASAGMGITALGLVVFVLLGPQTQVWLVAGNLALLGFGFALFSSPNMSAIMGSVERRQYGLASGTVATMRLLGQMFSMTVATIFLSIFIGRETIRPENYPLFLASMHACFGFFVILCTVGIGFSLLRGALRQ